MSVIRHTYLIPNVDTDAVVPQCVIVYRASDGEVCLRQVATHHDAEAFENIITDFGGVVLMRLEGEANLTNGEASVWVRR